ncbi:hypothetical protein VTL71DRAFT_2886 [Oculimacula yallundae]|uniref:RNase III domain-containing protein n=1 Tax=Oculimacula yallundae TaxID=86028 RepID=A0ABR4C6E2_9HELO
MSQQISIPAVESILNYIFNNKDLLWRALHAAGSPHAGVDGNKVMAMLGDTALRLVLMDYLISSGASRGVIDCTMQATVSNQNLTDICTSTSVARYINGNPSHVGAQSPKTKTATIEAVLGAVFLDSGKNIDSVRTAMIALGLHAPTATTMG